jgi:hypothetical protein
VSLTAARTAMPAQMPVTSSSTPVTMPLPKVTNQQVVDTRDNEEMIYLSAK